MTKKTLLTKAKESILLLSLLWILPITLINTTSLIAAQKAYSQQEEALFVSLSKFLYGTRDTKHPHKKWADWCKEWIDILDGLPKEYANLKTELTKVSRWKNALTIGSRLETALKPYVQLLPKEIFDRVDELGKDGMLEIIKASLEGRAPNI